MIFELDTIIPADGSAQFHYHAPKDLLSENPRHDNYHHQFHRHHNHRLPGARLQI